MELTKATVEPVTVSDVLELASWDRPRSSEELQDFIAKRSVAIALSDN